MRQILYILTNFQVSERLHGGPTFSGNYLMDYVIGFIIITSKLQKSKLLLGM